MRLGTAVPLGEGAMGRVLRAFDEDLGREVALKYLLSDDRQAVERFLREARAQAKVEHPNVAKVYQVGYQDERPFISMQLIDGKPLDEALEGRSLKLKVQVMHTIADALHAAHEVGLIHRDIKPSNILVEQHDDGALVPFVLDFGIARGLQPSEGETVAAARGLTVTGQALGTPGYMSPEQAAGDLRRLDRRSDVFGLGILLYELLAGVQPFASDSQLGSLVKVLQEDPPTLSRVAPDLPMDLRAITEQCLEKVPQRRYATAQALSEDLERWLDGRPVTARPLSAARRWWRRAQRNPVAAVAVASALLVTLGFGLWSVWNQNRSTREAAFAQEVGQTVERLEASLRLAHLAPRHDVRGEERRVLEEIAALEARAQAMSARLRGAADYARGRGFMALGHWQEAEVALEGAASSTANGPGVQLALGRTLAERFRQEIERAQGLESADSRTSAVAEARLSTADRAVRILEGARETAEGLRVYEAQFIAGLLALIEGRFDEAAERGSSATAANPLFYEGEMLRAEARLREVVVELSKGHIAGAQIALAKGLEAIAIAVGAGRSDPAALSQECRGHIRAMEVRVAQALPPDDAFASAQAACGRALESNPDYLPAYSLIGEAGWRMANALAGRGDDPIATLRATEGLARKGLRVRRDAGLLSHLGSLHWVWGNFLGDQGDPPDRQYAESLKALEEAVDLRPGDPYSHLKLGQTLTRYGLFLSLRGEDPVPAWQRAQGAFATGLLNAGLVEVELAAELCNVGSHWGYHLSLRGSDPTEYYHWSESACRRALSADPADRSARGNLALMLWSRALWEADSGGDAEPRFAEAAAGFEQILEEAPHRTTTQLNLTSSRLDQARTRLDRGQPVGSLLRKAAELLPPLRETYPAEFPVLEARMALLSAREVARLQGDAKASFEVALTKARASRTDEFYSYYAEALARTLRRRAEYLATVDAAEALRAATVGEATVGSILEREPTLTAAWAARVALEGLLAELSPSASARAKWGAARAASLAQLQELSPHLDLSLITRDGQ